MSDRSAGSVNAATKALASLGASEHQVRTANAAVLAGTPLPSSRAGRDTRPRRPARETQRLQHKVSHVRELLLQHGINADDSDQESA